MNQFLKYFGIILITLGVGVLGYYAMKTPVSNAPLIFSALLLICGVAVHIIINRIID